MVKSARLDLDGDGALTRCGGSRGGGPPTQLQKRYTPRLATVPKRPCAAIHSPRAAQVTPKGGAGDGTRTRDIQLGNRARQAHFMPVRAGL
jgi:hypothetical protein